MQREMRIPARYLELFRPSSAGQRWWLAWEGEDEASPTPTYKLLRTSVNLEELNEYGYRLAIWRENGNLAYVIPFGKGANNFPDNGLSYCP